MLAVTSTYTYNDAKGNPKTFNGEFRRWTTVNDEPYAVFMRAKTPLTVKESNLSPETLAALPKREQQDEPPVLESSEAFPPKPMTRELAEKCGFTIQEQSEYCWHLIWRTSTHFVLRFPRTSIDGAWKLALEDWDYYLGLDHLCRRSLELDAQARIAVHEINVYGIEAEYGNGPDWFEVMLEYHACKAPKSIAEPLEPPSPAQVAIEGRITANRQLAVMYADENPEPRFKPAPDDFEPSVKDIDVWAAARRAAERVSAHGLPIKRDGLFFRNRSDVWQRREVWPLVVWDDDMTLVLWRNGRIFLCAHNAAVEVDLPKSTLNKLYQLHFGGQHGA